MCLYPIIDIDIPNKKIAPQIKKRQPELKKYISSTNKIVYIACITHLRLLKIINYCYYQVLYLYITISLYIDCILNLPSTLFGALNTSKNRRHKSKPIQPHVPKHDTIERPRYNGPENTQSSKSLAVRCACTGCCCRRSLGSFLPRNAVRLRNAQSDLVCESRESQALICKHTRTDTHSAHYVYRGTRLQRVHCSRARLPGMRMRREVVRAAGWLMMRDFDVALWRLVRSPMCASDCSPQFTHNSHARTRTFPMSILRQISVGRMLLEHAY